MFYKKNLCLGYINNDTNKDNLFLEVEGRRFALHHEKTPIHDPKGKLLRN